MRHTFHTEQWLPYPIDLVFAFFANPENLPRLMPLWQKARIEEMTVAPPPLRPSSSSASQLRSIAAGVGTKLTISFRPFPYSPLRVPWEAEIDEFIWNDHFCDRQLRGPFAFWHHCHSTFAKSSPNDSGVHIEGTLLRDKLEYELPLGRLGEIANSLLIARQLRSTFDYRHARLNELLSLLSRTDIEPKPLRARSSYPPIR
jgi:ligand-binding SRPBCC domain-containing protein